MSRSVDSTTNLVVDQKRRGPEVTSKKKNMSGSSKERIELRRFKKKKVTPVISDGSLKDLSDEVEKKEGGRGGMTEEVRKREKGVGQRQQRKRRSSLRRS